MSPVPKPLYPGLYGWQVAYALPDGRVVFCACFREAMRCYFAYLRDELAARHLRTHHRTIGGKDLLKLAFHHFTYSINPAALSALFPGSVTSTETPKMVEGREFFFANTGIATPNLDESFWALPEKVLQFEAQICEVCTGRLPSHYYCHKMYGGPFTQAYGAWIAAELISEGHVEFLDIPDHRTRRQLWNHAENKIRRLVGVPQIGERFISETVLFKTVAYLLNGHEVIHHHRAEWLTGQELDIFVPALNLAIEYQGEQHFVPIDAWGGEDALKATEQRDEAKRRKCEAHGVTLIYFDYTMPLTETFVARRLRRFLAAGNE